MSHTTTPTASYRTMLTEAWRLTWQRKELWVFGFLASFLATGGVYDLLFRTGRRVEQGGSILQDLLHHSVMGSEVAGQYILQLQQLGPTRTGITLTAGTILLVSIIVIALMSQGALLDGLRHKKPQALSHLRAQAWQHLPALFGISFLQKTSVTFLTVLTTIPLFIWQLNVQTPPILSALFVTFFVLLIIINVLTMLSVIEATDKKVHTLNAIHQAATVFRTHWLAAFEFGVLLFLILFAAGLLLTLVFFLLTIPYALLAVSTLLTAPPLLFVWINIILALFFLLLMAFLTGGATTFQYAAWIQFHAHATHPVVGSRAFAKLLRFIKKD